MEFNPPSNPLLQLGKESNNKLISIERFLRILLQIL